MVITTFKYLLTLKIASREGPDGGPHDESIGLRKTGGRRASGRPDLRVEQEPVVLMDPRAELPVKAVYDGQRYNIDKFEPTGLVWLRDSIVLFSARSDRCIFLFKSDMDRIALPCDGGTWRCNICGGFVKPNADGFMCAKDGQIYMTS